MLRIVLRHLFPLLGVLVIAALFSAAVATATCGGEEEKASIEAKPLSLTFTEFNQKKSVTIENNGSVTWEIESINLSGGWELESTTCKVGKPYAAGTTCSTTFKFTAFPSGKYTGTYTVITNKSVFAQVALSGSY